MVVRLFLYKKKNRILPGITTIILAHNISIAWSTSTSSVTLHSTPPFNFVGHSPFDVAMSTPSSFSADQERRPPRSSITDYPLEVQIFILELNGMELIAQFQAIDTSSPDAPVANNVEASETLATSETLDTICMESLIWFHVAMLAQTNRRHFVLVMNHVRELHDKLTYRDNKEKERLEDMFAWLEAAKQKLEQISVVIEEYFDDQDIDFPDEEVEGREQSMSPTGGGIQQCRCCQL